MNLPATLPAELAQRLSAHAAPLGAAAPAELFADAAGRYASLAVEGEGLLLDFTRQRLDAAALQALLEWATACGLPQKVQDLFAGVHVNHTEDRAALHVALRAEESRASSLPQGTPSSVGGSLLPTPIPAEKLALVAAERAKLRAFVAEVRTGRRRGHTGQPFTDVLNIGIGGSDLGPVMAYEALGQVREQLEDRTGRRLRTHFASNIDGTRLAGLLRELDPVTTLVIICSKTFTTLEKLTNARLARDWLAAELGEGAVPKHFAAVSTNAKAMDAFGVGADARFDMWDWVGGRYSLWSAIGLAVELAVDTPAWEQFLAGGHAMDEHFRTVPLAQNLPTLLGLVGAWNRNFLDIGALGVLPYEDRLHRFAAYLQQLEMESNGKSVRRNGESVTWGTCPVVWGEPGNNAQHSFFQLLHQGNAPSALDVLVPARSSAGLQRSADYAVGNAMAQVEAFARGHAQAEAAAELQARGRSAAEVAALAPHKVHAGGRPTTVLAFQQLDAPTLGKLVALYEHKVYVQSVLWDLNPFDQWGVELGKKMAEGLAPAVGGEAPANLPVLGWLNSRR
jgi:glucose-6-phosphate isomerase